jgi:LmbE family N-acetylglucosaminyl deacetylase
MRKYLNILLDLNKLRKAASFSILAKAVASKLSLEIDPPIPAGPILVLSPHPDDDVFGCGGLINKLSKDGRDTLVLYLTNGDNQVRQNEALKACKILGATAKFWSLAENSSFCNEENIQELKKLISKIKPSIIMTPNLADPHPDHLETNKLLSKALSGTKSNLEIWQYEVWQPLLENRLINIESEITTKKQAISAHASQLKDRNYSDAIVGLNQYRAGMQKVGQYAEAYFASSKELFLDLFKLIS